MGKRNVATKQERWSVVGVQQPATLAQHVLTSVLFVGALIAPPAEAQIEDGGEGGKSSESCTNCEANKDCAGIPNGTTQMTDCGCGKPASSTFVCKICGDNTSCLDCAGVPFGPKHWSGPTNGVPGSEPCTKVCPVNSVLVAAQNRCLTCADIDANLMRVRYTYYHPTTNPTINTVAAFRSIKNDGSGVAIGTFAGLSLASSCLAEAVDSCLPEVSGGKNKTRLESLLSQKQAEVANLESKLAESSNKIQALEAQLKKLEADMASLTGNSLANANRAKTDLQRSLTAERRNKTGLLRDLTSTRVEAERAATAISSAQQVLMTAVRRPGDNQDGDTCIGGIVYGWLAGLQTPAEKVELTAKLAAVNKRISALGLELNSLENSVKDLTSKLRVSERNVAAAKTKLSKEKTTSGIEKAQQEVDAAVAARDSAATALKDAQASVAQKQEQLNATLLERANLATSKGFSGDTGVTTRTDLFGAKTTTFQQISGYVGRTSQGGCGPVDPTLLKIREQLQCDVQDIAVARFDSPVSLLWSPETSIESVASYAAFPLDGKTDEKKLFHWRASGMTPLVVHDPSRRGEIRDATQLFGSHTFGKSWENGYEALAALDTDKSGWLEGYELNVVALWFDFNQDGVSQKGEVKLLSDVGVSAIGVTADRVDEKTKNIFASKGFKRRVNGKEIIGGSVDWFSGVVKGPLTEEPGNRADGGPKGLTAAPPARRELAAQKNFDIVDPTTTVSGIWQWQITDDKSLLPEQRPGGILAFTQEGQLLRGQSLSAVEFRPNAYNIHEQISASSFLGSFGNGDVRFEARGDKGPKASSTAKLSADGMKLTGTTTEEVAVEGGTAKVTFAWEARRLVRAK